MDSVDEHAALLQSEVGRFLESVGGRGPCRTVLETPDIFFHEELWRHAAELGWTGVAVPEGFGGSGLGPSALCAVAEGFARVLAPVPFESTAMVALAIATYGSDEQCRCWLPEIARGEHCAALALGEADRPTCSIEGGKVSGVCRAVFDGAAAGLLLVFASSDEGPVLALIDAHAAGVVRSVPGALDPSRPSAHFAFTGATAAILPGATDALAARQALLDRFAILLACGQAAAAEEALELTRRYLLDRYAFGRPIGSFQALKHRMADAYVDMLLARQLIRAALRAWEGGSEEMSGLAAAAHVAVGAAFERIAQEMVQLHGGLGFTWEFDAHLFYRRAKLEKVALGSPDSWRSRLLELVDGGTPGLSQAGLSEIAA